MPFPAKGTGPATPRKPAGKSKTRKYVVWYCNKYKDSANEENWLVGEFRGTSINGAHNAVVRSLREKRPEIKKSEVLLMEVHILPPRTTLEQYLAVPDDGE